MVTLVYNFLKREHQGLVETRESAKELVKLLDIEEQFLAKILVAKNMSLTKRFSTHGTAAILQRKTREIYNACVACPVMDEVMELCEFPELKPSQEWMASLRDICNSSQGAVQRFIAKWKPRSPG